MKSFIQNRHGYNNITLDCALKGAALCLIGFAQQRAFDHQTRRMSWQIISPTATQRSARCITCSCNRAAQIFFFFARTAMRSSERSGTFARAHSSPISGNPAFDVKNAWICEVSNRGILRHSYAQEDLSCSLAGWSHALNSKAT